MFKFYLKKTIKKMLALILWPVFFVLSLFAKPMFFLLRLMSVPGILMSVGGIYQCITAGTHEMIFQYAAIAVISIIMLFAAPKIAEWIIDTKYDLKETALFPIVVRAKYKFTFDLNYV